jgi:GDP-4-dehydro-6-deoxy-D-mannose reductase
VKKVALITGISGMVGSHLAEYLISETDWNLVGMTRWRSPLENISKLTGYINDGSRVKLEYGDLTDANSINKVVSKTKPDYVFHLAAQSFPQASFLMPIQTFDVNISGTFNLLNALHNYSSEARIHVCSSSEVFGRVPKEFLPIKENAPFHPASPYAISKIGTDLIAKYFSEAHNMHIVITRMFTHTGPRRGDVFAESSFAKQIALIELGIIPPIIKVGNLDSLRTYADVRDAVRAYHIALTTEIKSGEVFNIGGNFTCTVREMLDFLMSKSNVKGIKIEVENERLRPIDADLQVPDTSKFREKTAWEPNYTFEETMNDLLNYWREKVTKFPTIQR